MPRKNTPRPFSLGNQRGMALLNVVFIFILIGVLAVAGAKMFGSQVAQGKARDTKGALESQARMAIAWAVSNKRLPVSGSEFNGVFGSPPLDAWGNSVVYYADPHLSATPASTGNSICGWTSTPVYYGSPTNYVAFALLSAGGASAVPLTSWPASGALTIQPGDAARIVTLGELQARAGCFGSTLGYLRIVNNELPNACTSAAYSATIYPDGGMPPYSYSYSGLPAGLTGSGATISGSPSATGTSSVTVTVTDSQTPVPRTVKRTYGLSVANCGGGAGSFDSMFIYGASLNFSGNAINGAGATAVLTGNLLTGDLNGGAVIAVSNIFVNGNVTLNGSQKLGSCVNPGTIFVNGTLTMDGGSAVYGSKIYVNNVNNSSVALSTLNGGTIGCDNSSTVVVRGTASLQNGTVWGDTYLAGDLNPLANANIQSNNVYVSGNLNLGWTPVLASGTKIYYPLAKTLSAPSNFDASILAKCIQEGAVPPAVIPITMPAASLPTLRANAWYGANGYLTSNTQVLASDLKIYSNSSYSSTAWSPSVSNVIIASKGDITITGLGGSSFSGILFAPKGKVTFNGGNFTGWVVARDGFSVTSGGSIVSLNPISTYIADPNQYPYVN
jgi:type II secretory pathway pseudopilin PulG